MPLCDLYRELSGESYSWVAVYNRLPKLYSCTKRLSTIFSDVIRGLDKWSSLKTQVTFWAPHTYKMDDIWTDPTFLIVYFGTLGLIVAVSYWAVKRFGSERVERWTNKVFFTSVAMDIITGNTRIHRPVIRMFYMINPKSEDATYWSLPFIFIALSLVAAYVAIRRYGYGRVEKLLYSLLCLPYWIDKFLLKQQMKGM